MCSEGNCCGPCCSCRCWFVTHVVFVMIGAIMMMPIISGLSKLSAIVNAGTFAVENVHDELELNLHEKLDYMRTINDFIKAITILMVIIIIFRIAWCVVGWMVVCMNKATTMHLVYVIFCGIDLALNLTFIILPAVKLGSLTGNIGHAFSSMSMYIVMGIVNIGLMDLAPILCFFACRTQTLSRYSIDGVPSQVRDIGPQIMTANVTTHAATHTPASEPPPYPAYKNGTDTEMNANPYDKYDVTPGAVYPGSGWSPAHPSNQNV